MVVASNPVTSTCRPIRPVSAPAVRRLLPVSVSEPPSPISYKDSSLIWFSLNEPIASAKTLFPNKVMVGIPGLCQFWGDSIQPTALSHKLLPASAQNMGSPPLVFSQRPQKSVTEQLQSQCAHERTDTHPPQASAFSSVAPVGVPLIPFSPPSELGSMCPTLPAAVEKHFEKQ